jgi:hypothetical protein
MGIVREATTDTIENERAIQHSASACIFSGADDRVL